MYERENVGAAFTKPEMFHVGKMPWRVCREFILILRGGVRAEAKELPAANPVKFSGARRIRAPWTNILKQSVSLYRIAFRGCRPVFSVAQRHSLFFQPADRSL